LRRWLGHGQQDDQYFAAPAAAANRWAGPSLSTARIRRRALEAAAVTERLEEQSYRAARHGLAYAYPMLDRRLLEFAIQIPGAFFIENGTRRAVLRNAVKDLLPDMVVSRREKLQTDPTGLLFLSQHRGRRIEQARKLSGLAEVRAVLDMDAVVSHLQSLPGPEAVRAEIADCTADNRQMLDSRTSVAWPLLVARFIRGGADDGCAVD
jgi:asparagine synthase (glutamine-hydrolysing)